MCKVWENLGLKYFFCYVRLVMCLIDKCWFDYFRCWLKFYIIKVLKKKEG